MTILGKILHRPAHGSAARRTIAALTFGLALVLAGCAAPQTGASEAAPATAHRDVAAPAGSPPAEARAPASSRPAPPMSKPLPAQRAPDPAPTPAATAPKIDVSCKSDADCVVKDVGNCCGFYPRCVNVNAAVDPKAVQAQCARSGMASVCGFKPVESCECVKGECQDKMMLFEGQ